MLKTLLILFFLIVFLVFLSLSYFFLRQEQRSAKKTKFIKPFKSFLNEKEYNPDISTDNWDLHKLRLNKFKRSQYKGLTFFVSSENRIYYLSEKGDKVYC